MVQDASVHPEWGADGYPLSPLQQGMLFHRLEAKSPGVDVEQCIGELQEEIDAGCFDRAWREMIARHASLRTGFVWENGTEPRQVVFPASRVGLRFQHAEFGSVEEARRGVEAYLAADRAAGFSTLDAPLFRIALFRAGPARHWWIATFHHLIADARTFALMFREAHEIHDALVAGQPLDLRPARPYRHYIDWLKTLDAAKAEKFWRAQLKGLTAGTTLPIARAANDACDASAPRGELGFRLGAAQTAALRAAAAKHKVTLNTLVQGAWSVLLSRYTGEDDVVFGAVRAGRHAYAGADETVGVFINTVPVRVRVPAAAPIGAWLRGLREQWVALREFEHTCLIKAQQWSDVPAGRPLFDTLLSFQDPFWGDALRSLGGKWATRRFEIRSEPNYPLTLDVYGGERMIVRALYERRKFSDETIARLLGHYRTLLEGFAGSAEAVGDLPLLTAAEREQVLRGWNSYTLPRSEGACVDALVEAHAARTPHAPAVADERTALDYATLNARANRLAHRLRALGVGPDTLVAVCMERSAEMLVAWLGVLKAGGAFVPLDPNYPPERLAFQLGDCRAPIVLTQPALRTKLPALASGVTVLEVQADGSGFESEPADNPSRAAAARNLAYVIYTSGSTGQPKGVQIEHHALMNLVTWHNAAFRVAASDRATQVASPAFDASVWETWPYLAAGASVHIPNEETRISPAALWRWMAAQKITISFLPTPLAEAAMNEPLPEGLVLRTLLTGGDKLRRPAPASFACELINNYGPTENTVVSTSGAVPRGASDEAFTPTIGRPVANTQCYILDTWLRPVPVGVAGELYVGGASLARGYLNRPELNTEKFVHVALEPGAAPTRLYRTGDSVRWTPQGEIEFLGRLDGQVKIRGHRIELGEIEATLQAHGSVRESVVVARPDERGQLQLVGYVLAAASEPAHESELLEFLRAKLPAYMVPAAIVALDAWPLTPNGKIDRKALPAPAARASDAAAFVAPGNATEQAVARVFGEILGRTGIGRHDNFFDLGGHSLLAAQVVSRLNHALSAALTVRAIFDHATVAALAREVEAHRDTNAAAARSIAQRVKRRAARPELEVLQPN